MGESIAPIRPSFNRSVHIEGRPERLTAETGALLLREADKRLGLTRDLATKLQDPRRGLVSHTLSELLRTVIILPALGWRDQDDADFLRREPALRIAVSDDRSVTPLDDNNDASPCGLASQPTLSRLHEALSTEHGPSCAASCCKVPRDASKRLMAAIGSAT